MDPSRTQQDDDEFDGRLPPPTFAAIETTMFCNLTCHFCIQYQNGTTVSGPHMAPEVFEQVSDKLFPHLSRFQPTVSGEPLMSKGLSRVLDKAHRMGVRAEYYTNGTLLNQKMIDLILPTAGRINISFDGATKETFEAMRRGAGFEPVIENISALVAAADRVPDEQRPAIGFACTLMNENIDELAALVDLAADLGLDYVRANHVIPGTNEVQGQSAYHDQPHAAACIEAAVARAEARQMPLSVQPLDQLTAKSAETDELAAPHSRLGAQNDGVVDGLAGVDVLAERCRPWPTPLRGDGAPDSEGDVAPKIARAKMPASIGACDFLWDRLYVGHEGNTTPCCIPGVPLVGDLNRQTLDEVWNGETERAMRVAVAQKNPPHCCRGCQHLHEIDDADEIARRLGGRRLPDAPVILPTNLRPITGQPTRLSTTAELHSAAPTLRWKPTEDADCAGYIVRLSTDAFRNLAFKSTWHGIEIHTPEFRLPEWVWAHAEPDQVVHWQALAILPDERRVVGHGAVQRSHGVTSS